MDNKVNVKKCHYCLYIRPNRNDYCIIQSERIKNTKEHSCEYFSLDAFVKVEEEQQQSDEPHKQKNLFKEVFSF